MIDPRKDHTLKSYSADRKFVQNIDQHLLESITTGQKNSVFHEGFDSISGFLSVSKSYGLLAHCTNFCVSLYNPRAEMLRWRKENPRRV